MKKYRVTVNGTVYEVELEELTGSAPGSPPAGPPPGPPPAPPAPPGARGPPFPPRRLPPLPPHLPRLPHRLPVSRSAPPCPATFWPSTSPPVRP